KLSGCADSDDPEGVVLAVVLADRDILAHRELLVPETKAFLVVLPGLLRIIEIPVAAAAMAQLRPGIRLAGTTAHSMAENRVLAEGGDVDTAIGGERHVEMVAVAGVACGMALLAGQFEVDMGQRAQFILQCIKPPATAPRGAVRLDRGQGACSERRSAIKPGSPGSDWTRKPSSRASASIGMLSALVSPTRAPIPCDRA